MKNGSTSITPLEQNPITFGEALFVVSQVLESLHHANLHLQESIGPSLGDGGSSLIEELQVLDRQAQVTLDLVDCLRRLADNAPLPPLSANISREKLFRLDATRNGLEKSEVRQGLLHPTEKEEFWL